MTNCIQSAKTVQYSTY